MKTELDVGEIAATLREEHRCFNGVQRFYVHHSKVFGAAMLFSVYRRHETLEHPVPVLHFLVGRTCNEET